MRLSLVRATRDRNNWSAGSGGSGGGSLASVRRLAITDLRFELDDRVRDLRLSGTAAHDASAGGALPLVVAAQGVLKGGEVRLTARGGALNGRTRGAAWPFSAVVQDGETRLAARGVLAQPLQFRGFDLRVAAQGPNLANMKYLVGVGLPNSAPYRLTGRLQREGRTTRATQLKAVIGASDFAGAIVSDGSKPRRLISIDLTSKVLHADDVGAFLADRPPHAVARSISGATPRGNDDGRVLSDEPIDLTRFRAKDARLKLAAGRFLLGKIELGRMTAEGELDHGRFDLKPVRMVFPSGRVDAAIGMDLNGAFPAFSLTGGVHGPVSVLAPSLARSLNGSAQLNVRVAGAGGSWKAVGLDAKGQALLSIRDGDIQRSKAKVLSGSVVQGAFSALANKSARTELHCVVADLGIGAGRIRGDRVVLVTDAGTALVEGGVDLRTETIDMTIHGRPARKTLFSVNSPVSIGGPMLKPATKVRLGGGPGAGGEKPEPPRLEGDPKAFCDQLVRPRAKP